MFLDFYNLREHPFGVTPDPRFLYFSPGHREALASLFCGIETGRGFLALVAQPGMGKTTLLYQLLDRMKDSVRHAFLFQTQCDSRDLLRYLLDGLGLDTCDGDFVRMHAKLNEFLFRQAQAGRRVVLLIDEAQNLSDSVLETVRLLSDFEATDRKLLQIVLAGQPELATKLLRPGMGQLRQRISVMCQLRPLPMGEVIPYITHRLKVAGYDGPALFTPDALTLIAEHSRGIPRVINNICFSALSLGCVSRCKRVGAEIVREAVADLSLESYVPRPAVAGAVPASASSPASPVDAPAFSLPSLVRMSFSSVRNLRPGKIAQRWLVRAGMFVVLLGYLLLNFSVGGQERVSESNPPSKPASITTIPSTDSRAPTGPAQGPDKGDTPAHPNQRESHFFTHVVRPNDTLAKLCKRTIGRYDAAVLSEIQELNWDLWDPDHIEVGQKIRLPLKPSNAQSSLLDVESARIQQRK